MQRYSLSLLIFLVANLAWAWERVDELEGMTLFRAEVPGSPVVAYRGSTALPWAVERIVSAICDTELKSHWMSRIRFVEVGKFDATGSRIEYLHLGLPWPLTDREFVVRSSVKREGGGFVVSYTSMEDARYPARSDRVRAQVYLSEFHVSPVPDQPQAAVDAIVHVDPGGSIPKWLINLYQRKLPRESLAGLKIQLARPEVRELRLLWLEPQAQVSITPASSKAP